MDVEAHKFIHIHMHELEAGKLAMLLDEIASSRSTPLPEWAIKQASDLRGKLKGVGV